MRAAALLVAVAACGAPPRPAAPAAAPAPFPAPTSAAAPSPPVTPALPTAPPVATPDAAPTAAELVEAVRARYAAARYEAKFRHRMTDPTFATTTVDDGKVWLVPPDRMRWDYLARRGSGPRRVDRSFIANPGGMRLVVVRPRRVSNPGPRQLAAAHAVAFALGAHDLSADFQAELEAGGLVPRYSAYAMRLTPRRSMPGVRHLTLLARPDGTVPMATVTADTGAVDEIHFYEPRFDAPIKDGWFQWPP